MIERESKKAVIEAKAKSFDIMYKELHTQEGQKKICKIAKSCDEATKDFTHIKQIKDGGGYILRSDKKIL